MTKKFFRSPPRGSAFESSRNLPATGDSDDITSYHTTMTMTMRIKVERIEIGPNLFVLE
jgi:hypothetical protein